MAGKGNPNIAQAGAATRFKPGVSGNPGGMPSGTAEIKEQARAHGPAAIKFLAGVMGNGKNRLRDRIEAAKVLLDRGFGRPTQPNASDDEPHLTVVFTDEIATRPEGYSRDHAARGGPSRLTQ